MFINFPEVPIKIEGMELVKLPKMYKVKQKYDSSYIKDIKEHIISQMNTYIEDKDALAGKNICITVGSRGIPQIDVIVKTIIDQLKLYGAHPFIVPAMGSHGGANSQGQVEYISSFGITEEAMGVEIKSSMEVVQIGVLADNTPVYCDKIAYNSDGIVVLNKIKPHTDFRAKHESGLAKMMAIGLANNVGASMFHKMGFGSFSERIPQSAEVFLENAPVLFGVGLIQNAYDKISELEVIPKDKIMERDAALLEIAKNKIANLKLNDINLLIIDEIGKNISGNGHDPNVVGRSNSPGFEDIINIQKVFIKSLTEETHNNACGINHADITTRGLLNEVDFSITWTNCATATVLHGGKIPVYAETDLEAIKMALLTCNGMDFDRPRIIRIKNTLELEEILVSETFLDEIENKEDLEILSGPHEMSFKNGSLI